MADIAGVVLGPETESRDNAPLLKFILVWVVIAFGGLALYYFGLMDAVIETDRTRISQVVLTIFLLGSLHCLYQTMLVSRDLIAARKVRETLLEAGPVGFVLTSDGVSMKDGRKLAAGTVTAHIAKVVRKAGNLGTGRVDQTELLRSLAGRLRGREKLGFFISESLLRIALLGTAVGFIIMLIPISGLRSFEADMLRETLTAMTGGMAIALNVTVAGIGTALLLKFQYFLLDAAITELFQEIAELTDIHVIPALDTRANG